MRPIPIRLVHMYLAGMFFLALAASGVARGCVVHENEAEISAVQNDINDLRWLEGSGPESGNQARGEFQKQLYYYLAQPEYAETGLPGLVKHIKAIDALKSEDRPVLDPTGHWPVPVFAHGKEMNAVIRLADRYPVMELLSGKKTVSQTVRVPEPVFFWSALWWKWCYAIASALAVLVFVVITMAVYGLHPIVQYPWHRPDALLVALLVAPVSLPAIAVFGLKQALTADWTDWYGRAAPRFALTAYRIGLLRRLPCPAFEPERFAGAVSALRPELAAANLNQEAQSATGPQWYAVRRSSFLGSVHRLKEAGLEVYPISLRSPKKIRGFAVPADRIEEFERAVGLVAVQRTDSDTDVDRVICRSYASAHGDIEICDAKSDYEPQLRRILKAVSAKAGGAELCLRVCDSGHMPLAAASQKINVFWPASPAENPAERQTTRLFGREWTKSVTVLTPSLQGIVIKDEDGLPIAQVVGNSVYVLVAGLLTGPLADKESDADELLARLLHEAVAASRISANDDEELSKLWRESSESHARNYVEQCLTRLRRRGTDLEKEIGDCDKQIVRAGQSIHQQLRLKREKAIQLEQLLGQDMLAEEERLRAEFAALCDSKAILSIEVHDRDICVHTRTVFIDWQGKRYRIGRFLLRLADDGRISIANVANFATGTPFHHPHVPDPDRPCFGNVHESLVKLVADRQYASAVTLLFRYLESYNPHNGVADIKHWKEVPHAG